MSAFTDRVVRDFPWTVGSPDLLVLEAAYQATIETAARVRALGTGADPYEWQVAARDHARTSRAYLSAARRLGILAQADSDSSRAV